MENKEPNNKKDKDSENKRTVFFLLIAASIVFGFFVLPVLFSQYDREPVVVYTLSKEQLEGYGYTTKESLNIDVWESGELDDPKGLGNNTFEITAVGISDPTVSENTYITVTFPLDINTASVEELVMVKGIGEVTANKIVEYRGINGYFYSMDELLNVDGIGKKKLAALNGYLYIDCDLLPETLPYTREQEYDNAAEPSVVTTVPPNCTEAAETSVRSAVTTEDFVMQTEEFITGTDDEDEFETEDEDYNYGYSDWYSENRYLFETSETEYYPNFPIELNSADVKDLICIKGIGESTAGKIVEYARNVGFASVDDLLNVSGIGRSKLELIRPYVYVVSDSTAGFDTGSSDEPVTSTETSFEIYRVNINVCDKSDLMQLPGIDEALADEILELRNEIGYFKNIEELSFAVSNEQLSEIWNYVFV